MQINAEQLNDFFWGGGGASLLQHQNIIKMLVFFLVHFVQRHTEKEKSHHANYCKTCQNKSPAIHHLCNYQLIEGAISPGEKHLEA